MSDSDVTEREPWPGPLTPDNDEENYVNAAIGSIIYGWKYDDPEWRHINQPRLNDDQLAAFAIWVVTGQIENGGITQVFYNSYGELAEEAQQGLRQFGMSDFAEILEEAFSRFARPVPVDRQDRWKLLELLSGVREHDFENDEEVSEIFQRCARHFDDLDDRYFVTLKNHGDNMLKILAQKIDERQENFFQIQK